MSIRIKLARGLLRLGTFIQSLPLVVMNAEDLVEFNRESYSRPQTIESWANDEFVNAGLTPEELDLLAVVPDPRGKLLLLGVGGGREAIPLAEMGFEITGVDYVASMVERARQNAARRGVHLDGIVQDMSQLQVPGHAFAVVWLSSATYSCVPTRTRRVEMVRRIARVLQPGGYFLFQFQRTLTPQRLGQGGWARRLIATCVRGNTEYQTGDTLWGNIEFLHAFASPEEVQSEIEDAGLAVVCVQTNRNPTRCGVVCQKRA